MRIVTYSNEKPPVYERCRELFGADWDKGIIMAYGDTIHSKYDIPDHLKAHEQVHVEQQANFLGGKDQWWDKYFEDRIFRFIQEIEAYKAQVAFAKQALNRDGQRKLKKHILKDASENHGDMCTKAEAELKIYGN